MRTRQRLRRAWPGLTVLLVLLAAVPSRAVNPVPLRGVAGSWGVVTVKHGTTLDPHLREVRSLTADRGPFVGFALVGPETVLTYVEGRKEGAACSFGRRCEVARDRVASAQGPSGSDGSSFFVPAGTYRFVLLGAPDATVSLHSTFSFLRGPTRLQHRGRVQLERLASTTPPLGDRQPQADGAQSFEARGDAVTGLVWRVDGQDLGSLRASICIGEGGKALPNPSGLCDPGGSGESISRGSSSCSIGVAGKGCLPGSGGPVSITRGIASFVAGGSYASYAVTVQASKSRVFGWAWNVRL